MSIDLLSNCKVYKHLDSSISQILADLSAETVTILLSFDQSTPYTPPSWSINKNICIILYILFPSSTIFLMNVPSEASYKLMVESEETLT